MRCWRRCAVHAGKREHRIMAILEFKFDESFTKRFMSVGGWIGEADEWKKLEISWQKHIDRCNFFNRTDQRITRAHASQMDKFKDEFANWNEQMASSFQQKLLGFIGRRKMLGVAMGADLDALAASFPDNAPTKERHWRAYTLCIKFTMNEIGKFMESIRPADQVRLIHDRGSWDARALEAYNLMIEDRRWKYRNIFTGITPRAGTQSVGLQAADLLVYEAHKAIKSIVVTSSGELTKAMQTLLHKQVPVIARYLDNKTVSVLAEDLERSRGKRITAVK